MMSSRARKDVIPPAPLEYEMVMQYRRKTKLASSFTSRPVSKDGLQSYCRECSTVKIKLRRKLFYEEINEIKRVPCFDCKIQYPQSVSVVIGSCVSEETA